ncbi:ABC transporter permease [Ensifer sp. NPDC090286]|uniref:ABC transporter permease n=1 Tax=Ensifer sp. NPDC090286 TaxID=3363991 RepID=UPI00383A0F8F
MGKLVGGSVMLGSTIQGILAEYSAVLLEGAVVTLKLLIVSSVGGFVLALPVSVALGSSRRRWRYPAALFTLVLRGSPLFVQVFLVYYGLPQILTLAYGGIVAIKASFWWPLLSSPFLLISIAFVLNMAAYMAEDIRSGLATIPKGEREAAIACGMSEMTALRRVKMPWALRTMMPVLFNEVVLTLKATTLASTITLRDLLGAGSMIFARTFDMTIYLVLAVFYLIMAGLLTVVFRYIERRFLIAHRIANRPLDQVKPLAINAKH